MTANPWRKPDGRANRQRRTDGPLADDTDRLLASFCLEEQRAGLRTSTIFTYRQKLLLLAERVYPAGLCRSRRR